MKKLNILAIDAAGGNFLVSLSAGGKEFLVRSIDRKSDKLMLVVQKLFSRAGIVPSDLNVLAVGLGPGSFTGIRVAISVAKGFAVSLPLKLVVFDSFELLAYNKTDKAVVVIDGFSKFVFARTENGEKSCIEIENLKKSVLKRTKIIAFKKVFDEIEKGQHIEPEIDLMGLVKKKVEDQMFVSVDELVPIYLRASQAEIELEKRKSSDFNTKGV